MSRWPMIWALGFCLLALCSCNDVPNFQVTTRQGATFSVSNPHVNYQSICQPGLYSFEYLTKGDWETEGLRVGVGAVDRNLIPWTSIDEAEFISVGAGPCYAGIDASVRLHDGQKKRVQLVDPLNQGLWGDNKRGAVMIPLDNIKELKAVPREGSTPEKTETHVVAIKITMTGGEAYICEAAASYGLFRTTGNVPAREDYSNGLIVMISGAQFDIKWSNLRSIDKLTDSKYAVRITYSDGSTEDAELESAGGSIRFTAQDCGRKMTEAGSHIIIDPPRQDISVDPSKFLRVEVLQGSHAP